MSHKAAAIVLGVDKGQLTRQFQGDGHLSAKRVGLLPREVLLAIADGIKAHYGANDPQAERERRVKAAIAAMNEIVLMAMGEVK
jgi:hypothetical protein